MNGRRIYHARGKVLGGSSSINGMIFQRGNPLDYERWAADPGMETWDYAHCLPYFKRMENCLAAEPDDAFRGAQRSARAGARARRPTRCSARSSRRCSRPATRSPTTSTATARRASPRSTATSTAAGGCRAARAYLHPVMQRPNLDVAHARVRHAGPLRRHARGRRRVLARPRAAAAGRRRRGHPLRRRDQLAAAAAALRRRRRRRAARRSGIDVVARPARRRREPAGPPRGLRPVRVHAAGLDAAVPGEVAAAVDRRSQWLFLRSGPGRDEPLRGAAASSAATTTSPTRT